MIIRSFYITFSSSLLLSLVSLIVLILIIYLIPIIPNSQKTEKIAKSGPARLAPTKCFTIWFNFLAAMEQNYNYDTYIVTN